VSVKLGVSVSKERGLRTLEKGIWTYEGRRSEGTGEA